MLIKGPGVCDIICVNKGTWGEGGGLLENFSEIDFLVVSSRGDRYLSYAFGPIEIYCSLPKLSPVKCQRICVITLCVWFSIKMQ